ncbi:MAG: pilus assembly protein [Massilia sp.]
MKLSHLLRAVAVLSGALLLAPAQAGQTNIARVPLLNMTGAGSVKPNLMLLFDNSGSMDWHFLPDSLGNGNTYQCRAKGALRETTNNTLCSVGHPPFNASDINKQYYNPATRYQPPIKYDGSSYPSYGSGTWGAVPMDGFGSRAINMSGQTQSSATATTNLLTGFPDLAWCDSSALTNCRRNTATYTYPDNTFTYPNMVYTAPYYYNIGVAQFCADANLTNCVSTSVGAAAPTGYPFPVKVRWCDTLNLNNCQAKQVGNFKYPSFSQPSGATVAFGTITIGASSTTRSLTITSVTIPDPTTARTITNGTVTAAAGTDTAAKQQTLASQLAASIMAKTGLTNQYWACVRNPVGTTTVSPCSSYGINLSSDNVVAVIPLDCTSTSNKSVTNCSPSVDAYAAGWGITVTAPSVVVSAATNAVPPTSLIGVSGTTANNGTPKLASVSVNGTTLASNIQPGTNKSASQVVTSIVNAVNGGSSGYTAYAGGNSITPTCAAKNNTFVCLIKASDTTNGDTPLVGAVTSGGSIGFSYSNSTGYVAAQPQVTDSIPTQTQAIAAGSAPASTFQRVDIVSTNNSYPRAPGRTDCAASTCTYNEEMTNFANWYAYYKTRIQMTKTAVGLAFAPVTGNFRVGLSKMSVSAIGGAIDVVPADFTSTARQTWYNTFYATTTSGSTPTRPALDNVGKMFANLAPYNYAAGKEVVQYPCQQNFILLTTDGYWNQGYSGSVTSNDESEDASRFCTAGRACVDTRSQSQASLADIALYWYNGGSNNDTVSLRPSIDDVTKTGLVAAGAGENSHLHVNTFTLGLGIDGIMNYEEKYDTTPVSGGDFYNLLTRVQTGCPWNNGGAYVWPDPKVTDSTSSTVQERVDDLWHTAINGHGKYFSASDPQGVQAGLNEAIAGISIRVGAASAAATSTPNISKEDNNIFTDTFVTGKWYGELSNKQIDLTTGLVNNNVLWTTSNTLGAQVAASTDSRKIYFLDRPSRTGVQQFFKYSNLPPEDRAWFDNKCSKLAQCGSLSPAEQTIVNAGANIVDWLRGQQQYADDHLLRAYSTTDIKDGPVKPIVLGDIASSKPAFLRAPIKSYTMADYSVYKETYADRAPTVFTAANDGMLHAFDASNGNERWAFVPRVTMQKLHVQASTNYNLNHQFTTDGSPELGDVQIDGKWRTMLVAGLNGGGRGYYGIDVTEPDNPVVKWELCADSTIGCTSSYPEIGLTFGNPQFGYYNNKWVVFLTSGYNNVAGSDGVNAGTTGHGVLLVVDVATGEVLHHPDTLNGSVSSPAGLAKITSISSNPFTDPVTTYVYGGDNTGQMWRFDMSTVPPTVVKMGDAGANQPITTRPEVTQCLETDTVNGAAVSHAQRLVIFGTGRLLDLPDISDTSTQSLYGLKDKGSAIANIRGGSMVQQVLSVKSKVADPNAPANSSTNLLTYTATKKAVDLSVNDGWYLDLNQNQGERINLDPQVIDGGVNVVSTMPTSSSACQVGGSSNVYQFNVCTGSYVGSDGVAGSTLSNSAAAVGFIIVRLPSGSIKMITTTANGSTITTNVSAATSKQMRKVGWRSVNGE